MDAYLPTSAAAVWSVAIAAALTVFTGYCIARQRRRAITRVMAWGLVVSNVVAALWLTAAQPPGVRMLVLIVMLLLAMKAVVAVESPPQLTPWQWIGFAAAWPGMRPAAFASAFGAPLPGAGSLVCMGLARALLGMAIVWLARLCWIETHSLTGATLLLLPGVSLVLHFGLFNIVAGLWRWSGADCTALFRAPLRATSLVEFWGRRWNLGFSEMTSIAVYRPLSNRFGRSAATIQAFLFSGMLHELAISVPVHAGYGGPLGYFALHAVLMVIERGLTRSGQAIDRIAWVGRAWTLFWLILPAPLLFHLPFLRGVVWPLIGMTQVVPGR